MGGAESTPRKITIPNENQFIKITDSLAERLMSCKEEPKKEESGGGGSCKVRKEHPQPCPSPKAPCKGQNMKDIEDPCDFVKQVSDSENIPPERLKYSNDALINYYYGPSITSLRILQAKEKELKESEVYWSKRIQNLEEHHSELKEIMEREYNKAVSEINNQVPRPPPDTPFPCCNEKERVINCYNRNPDQALLCALEVSQFADCVQNKRIDSLRNEEPCPETPPLKEKVEEEKNARKKKKC